MRALLKLLGIGRPDPNRRESVALPSWVRLVAPTLVVALTLASLAVLALVRALVG